MMFYFLSFAVIPNNLTGAEISQNPPWILNDIELLLIRSLAAKMCLES